MPPSPGAPGDAPMGGGIPVTGWVPVCRSDLGRGPGQAIPGRPSAPSAGHGPAGRPCGTCPGDQPWRPQNSPRPDRSPTWLASTSRWSGLSEGTSLAIAAQFLAQDHQLLDAGPPVGDVELPLLGRGRERRGRLEGGLRRSCARRPPGGDRGCARRTAARARARGASGSAKRPPLRTCADQLQRRLRIAVLEVLPAQPEAVRPQQQLPPGAAPPAPPPRPGQRRPAAAAPAARGARAARVYDTTIG